MKSLIWELSSRIVSEQRYLALKDSTKFQERASASTRQGYRYIRRLIRTSYALTSVMMFLFSYFLVVANNGVGNQVAHVQIISFVIYAYIFIFSLYSVIMFINIIRSYGLFEPIKPLPTSIGHQVLHISWFLYNGSSSLFIVIPLISEYVFLTHSYYAIPLGLLWAFATMALGYMLGIILATYLGGRHKASKGGKLGALANIARILGVIGAFVIFEVALQEPGNLPALPAISFHQYFLFLPLINIPYTAFPVSYLYGSILPEIFVTLLYISAIAILFLKFNRIIFGKITNQENQSRTVLESTGKKTIVHGFYRNTFIKDMRNIFRKPQNATLIIVPIIFVTPTLFQIFFYSSSVSFGSISLYYALMSIVVVSSSFYAIALIISEGNGISVLQSLPITLSEVVYSKNIVGTVIFTVIVTPISILFLFKESPGIAVMFLLPANLVVVYVYTSLFNIRRLVKKLPRGVSTVNFYSFGGGIALTIMFLITMAMAVVPTGIATAISHEFAFGAFSHPLFFYLSTLALNLCALFIVMNVVNRSL